MIAKEGKYYFVDGKQADYQLYKRYLDRRHEYEQEIAQIDQEDLGKKAQKRFESRLKSTSTPDGVYEWTTPDGTKGKSVLLNNNWVKNSTFATTPDGKEVYMEEPPYNADIGLIKDDSGDQNIDAFRKTLEAKTEEMKKLGMRDTKIRQEIIRMMDEAGVTYDDMGY